MKDAFYVRRDDGGFAPTDWTRGPWDTAAQHGGPPSALLAHAVDALVADDSWIPARTNIEILRPIPLATLTTRAQIDHRGRTTIRASAVLEHAGEVVAVARILFIRQQEESPQLACEAPIHPMRSPKSMPEVELPFFPEPVSYHRAIELRMADTWPAPEAQAWASLRFPLVFDEPTTGWERALVFVDAAHGVAPGHDPRNVLLINPDLELSLIRRPFEPWIGLHIRTTCTEDGVGITRSTVHDICGVVGAASATLVVRPRVK